MNFFTKAILGSVAVLLAAVAVVLLFRSGESARVEAMIREAVGWAAQGDAERVAGLIDSEYEDGAEWARGEIRNRIRPGAFEKLEVVEVKAGVTGDDAHVRLVVRIQTRDVPAPYPETFRISLRKREAGWRVIDVERAERRRP